MCLISLMMVADKKTSTDAREPTREQSKYDSLRKNVGGYNISRLLDPRVMANYDDPNHRIVINPTYFKKIKNNLSRLYLPQTDINPEEELGWKHTLHHEFTHSGDVTRENYKNKVPTKISYMKEYVEIQKDEPYFTPYANSKISEAFAEHGGYISRMEANPSEQNRKILIRLRDPETGERIEKQINYAEYKEMYPKHYEFFMRKFKEGF